MDFNFISTPLFAIKDGIIKEGNKAFFELLGVDPKEAIGRPFLDFIDEESSELYSNTVAVCSGTTGEGNADAVQVEVKLNVPLEGHRFINLCMQKYEHANAANWYIISAYDSTHYNDMYGMLKIREEQYKSLLDNMEEEVTIEDPQRKIIYANDAYCRYYGLSREEAIGRDGLTVVLPEDWPLYEQIHELTTQNPDYRLECRVKRADGSIIWVEATGKGFFDQSGKLVECQEVARDITISKNKELMLANKKTELERLVSEKTKELVHANNQLAASGNYLNNILQNISEGVAVYDSNGKLQTINDALKNKFGDQIEEFTKAIGGMLTSGKGGYLTKLYAEYKSFSDQEIIISTNGKNLHCLISGSPLADTDAEKPRYLLIIRLISEVRQLVNRFSGFQATYQFDDIVTCSENMQEAIRYAKTIAGTQSNILIEGESGTGKELFAQAIHNASERSKGPFVAVNCGAIPADLIGSELFGYSEGSFTGAKRGGKPGKFELATSGTIFLDEIADMPLAQQTVLLRVLQERKIMRIGDEREIPIDTRVICATNKNLYQEVQKGRFREDLYYRLNVIRLKIPPLRERLRDIHLLVDYFIGTRRDESHPERIEISPEILKKFSEYSWPGNVRELQNIVERIIYMADIGSNRVITMEYLLDYIFGDNGSVFRDALQEKGPGAQAGALQPDSARILQNREQHRKRMEDAEKSLLIDAMNQCECNVSMVSRKLGLSRKTVYQKLKKYELTRYL